MDYRKFGQIVSKDSKYIIIKGGRGYTFRITPLNKYNIIEVLVNSNHPVLVLRDYPLSPEDSSTFMREVGNDTYYFQKGIFKK